MNHKQMPRLGSAIASTILSVFWAVSLVGVDKAQAAVLTYQMDYDDRNYFKVDNSLLTGIGYEGYEQIPIIEGRFYGFTLPGGREYYDLSAGQTTVLFYQREFRGLMFPGAGDSVSGVFSFPGDELDPEPYYYEYSISTYWSINYRDPEGSVLNGYYDSYRAYNGGPWERWERFFYSDVPVSYTLVNTEPSPVPEPLTAGGTALALAGLSWLKHKKKMAA
jgi:hypothetical protein